MSLTIELLQQINNRNIYQVTDKEFHTYGRIVHGIDFTPSITYLEKYTTIPKEGNVYEPSVKELEVDEVMKKVSKMFYGGMEVQFGFCNGKNSHLNGMEYHKGSEILVAVTDCMLFLGHIWDMNNNQYESEKAEVFYVKAGQIIELYQTTLHLSPCKVRESGFKAIIILPRGTNIDFDHELSKYDIENEEENKKESQKENKEESQIKNKEEIKIKNKEESQIENKEENKIENKEDYQFEESIILHKKNKWIITHPDWRPLVLQGVKPGILGERIFLYYLREND